MSYASIEESSCIGCGTCEALCPEVFEMTVRDTAQAIGEVVDDAKATVQRAMNMCPVKCIYWDD